MLNCARYVKRFQQYLSCFLSSYFVHTTRGRLTYDMEAHLITMKQPPNEIMDDIILGLQ